MESSGERLKKIRLSKGIKLEDVQKKTKIHLSILQALEGDGISDLNPIYLKGFLKLYCHFLGVDPKNYIPDYQEPKGIVSSTRLEEMAQEKEPVVEKPKPVERPAYKQPEKPFHQPAPTPVSTPPSLKIRSSEPKPNSIVPIIGVVILTGLLSFGLFSLGKAIFSKRHDSPAAKSTPRKAVLPIEIKREDLRQERAQKARPEASAAAKSGSEQQSMAIPVSRETVSGIRLVIRAKENCWISLKLDGRVVFQRVLEKGRFGGWKAKDRIELSLGNAGAVELEINGKLFTNLGRRGQARKNIVITREGLNIEG